MRARFFVAPLALFAFLCLCSPSEAQFGAWFFISQGAACTVAPPLPIGSDVVVGAYGVRLLKTGYAGKLVRVQRSSDNTQTDIGTVNGCDLDAATFNNFCNATSCFVAKFYNQTGGADASQATLANMPQILLNQQNGHPGLIFNGTSSELDVTLGSGIGTSLTYAVVAKTPSSFGSNSAILANYNDASNAVAMATLTTSNNCVVDEAATGFTTAFARISCATSTAYRWVGRMTPTLRSVYLNGTKGTDDTSSITLNLSTGLTIGRNSPTGTQPWGGSISEVIIFAPDIGATDALAVSSNQGSYWNL